MKQHFDMKMDSGGWRAALEKDGMLLARCDVQTRSLQLAAVRQNGLALQFVRMPDSDVCVAAVSENPAAIEFVPPAWREAVRRLAEEDGAGCAPAP